MSATTPAFQTVSAEALVVAVLVLAVVAGVLLYLAYEWFRKNFLGRAGYSKKTFITRNEADFYRRLKSAAEPRWVVFPQVAMGALMNTNLKPDHARYWEARSTFAAKICDFVLCDAKTLEPQLIIELDDVMHDFERDKKRDCISAMAGYRTLRFWSKKKPSVAELREHLDRALALN